MRGLVIEAFARSIDTVFLVGVPIAIIGFAITLLLREVPLRSGQSAPVDVADEVADGAGAEAPVSSRS